MNKQAFLAGLEKELKEKNVADLGDIIASMSSTLPISWRTATARRKSPRSSEAPKRLRRSMRRARRPGRRVRRAEGARY
jgi:hypothetical protein